MLSKYKQTRNALIVFLITVLFSSCAFAFSFNSILDIFKTKKVEKVRVVRKGGGKNEVPPVTIKVGTYVLHVGRYDLQSATYHMDFYLIFKCTPNCRNLNFEVMNAVNAESHLVASDKNSMIYRVQADLSKADNLRNYPFDSHALDVVVENRQMTNDKMVFEVDPTTTALDSDLEVVGFHLLPHWIATVSNHYYQVFQQTYSSYKFSIHIARPFLAGFLKGILPALIIISCNFLALFMKIDHISQRLGVSTSTLIAAEVFHLNLTASLPPLGYTTYADMFMLINYIFLFTVLIEVVITTYCIETKHHALAAKINNMCAWLIPSIWVILQAINWLIFNPTG